MNPRPPFWFSTVMTAITIALLSVLVPTNATSINREELFRYESVPTGPLLSVQTLGAGDRDIEVEMVFKLGAFSPKGGGHLALGVGDLSRYFNTGLPPLGNGIIVGQASMCPDQGATISLLTEQYGTTGADPETCFSGLAPDAEYRLVTRVTADQRIQYTLWNGDQLLATRSRAAGNVPPHSRGLFLVGLPGQPAGGAFTLVRLIAVALPAAPSPSPATK